MELILCNNQQLQKTTHYVGQHRYYKIEIDNGKIFSHKFDYVESNVNEYTITNAVGISGSRSHHYFGIIKDQNYYFQEWSKGCKPARTDSDFWKKLPVKNTVVETKFDIDNKNTIKFNEPVNLLFSINAYWHWFCEDLPLFKFLRTNSYKIVTNKLSSWQRESISFFPDIAERIVEVETPAVIESPKYHLFSKPDGGAGRNASWVTKFLKENFKPSTNYKPNKKIYISRNDAQARAVDNEQEVKEFLSAKGFELYDNFAQYSLQQKIDIFNQAQLVVSPTGANLCHCYAMQPHTTVIDFNHRFLLTDEHWYNNIGDASSLKWKTFAAATGKKNVRPRERNRNLIVDLNTLNNTIKNAGF